jgi:hypothetical protein
MLVMSVAFCDSGSSSNSSGGGGSDSQTIVSSSIKRTAFCVGTLHGYRLHDSVCVLARTYRLVQVADYTSL